MCLTLRPGSAPPKPTCRSKEEKKATTRWNKHVTQQLHNDKFIREEESRSGTTWCNLQAGSAR